jgi:DNA-binding response OmpR family regulator
MDVKHVKALLIEDSPEDARLIREMLNEVVDGQFELESAEELSAGLERMAGGGIDVVLLDLSLPDSRGLDTFIRVHGQAPDMPFVLLTGLDDEALAVRAVKMGAQDYLVKGRVGGNLLVRSMRYAIERNRLRVELKEALDKIKTLKGLLPICAWCKKIRDDKGYWKQLEAYIREHSEADFTHGICPECLAKLKEEDRELKDRQ